MNNQNFKVGDEVFDILLQEKGVVILDEYSSLKIKVLFGRYYYFYTLNGKRKSEDKNPILMHYIEGYNYMNPDFNNLPVEKRWRAEKGKNYYSIGKVSDVNSTDMFYATCIEDEDEDNFDMSNYNKGNYFQTREQAQEVSDKMNSYFKKIVF